MNFTDKYIKMCEEATEIQKGHNWQNGDYIFYLHCDYHEKYQSIISCDAITQSGYHDYKEWQEPCDEDIWLPRQDQLQEMAFVPDVRTDLVINDLRYFVWEGAGIGWANTRDSMNEFLLAFVMHELHKKKWNNTKEVWE